MYRAIVIPLWSVLLAVKQFLEVLANELIYFITTGSIIDGKRALNIGHTG